MSGCLPWTNTVFALLIAAFYTANGIHSFQLFNAYYMFHTGSNPDPSTFPYYWNVLFYHASCFSVILWSIHVAALGVCYDFSKSILNRGI